MRFFSMLCDQCCVFVCEYNQAAILFITSVATMPRCVAEKLINQ
jgi:hypothetical protein